MKKLIAFALVLSSFSQAVLACEFTSIKASVKVQSRTLDYSSHKEKITKVGSLKGAFVKNSAGSYKVFKSKDAEYQLPSLTITEKYDYYTTRVNLSASLTGEQVVKILTEAIGKKKLKKEPKLAAYLALINPTSSVALTSSYYAFHGSYYGETDNETYDEFEIIDPANKDNKLIVSFDFKKKTKCN